MHRAIIFVPPGSEFTRWSNICAAYCLNRDYVVVAIATTWEAAMKCLMLGEATVAVVGKPDHLPPDRLPRMELVIDEQNDASPGPKRRRTQRQTWVPPR